MKSLRNKVILSGIVLLFAFIATIGSTYAWFTVSTQTTVEALNLQVAASDNLLIRIKKLNDGLGDDTYNNASDKLASSFWSTSITNQNFLDAGYFYTGADPWRISPVTVINDDYLGYDAKVLKYLDSTDTDNRGLVSIVDPAEYNSYNGYYIKIDLYLLSLSDDDKIVELDKSNTSITALQTDNRQYVDEAVRLVVFAGAGAANIYGKTTDYLFDFTGSEEENSITGEEATTVTVNETYFNAIADITTPVIGLSTSVHDFDDTGITTNPDIVTLTQNTPTLVTIYVYIEGWNQYATNYIVGANFDISFGFKFELTDND
jgi:hypothetical protein